MARATRDSKLETRSARARLSKSHEPYWRLVGSKLYIGYRKGPRGGVWYVRYSIEGKYIKKLLGEADDHLDSNSTDVLTYFEAQDKAREFVEDCKNVETGNPEKPYTVSNAIDDYMEWYKAHRKSPKHTQSVIDAHIKPTFKNIPINELTTKKIRKWHHTIAGAPARLRSGNKFTHLRLPKEDDPERNRRRKATANRVLTVLKAILNKSLEYGHAETDIEWKRVKPFQNVSIPRIRYLTEGECARLINGCAPEFRPLIKAGLLSGARWGEIISMQCHDFNHDSGTVLIQEAKNSNPRHIPLSDEGVIFFKQKTAGRSGSERIFKRNDGNPFGRSHQTRPMREACINGKIDPPISFHILRHTYGSLLANKGVPIPVIAEALGHKGTKMTEKHYGHLTKSYVAETIRANLPEFGVNEKDNVRVLRK